MKTFRLIAMVVAMLFATALQAESLYEKGANAYNNGDYARALEIFEKQLKSHPNDNYALGYVGAIAVINKEADKAIENLNKAITRTSDDEDNAEFWVWLHDTLATAHLLAGDTIAAIDDMSVVIDWQPDVYSYDRRGTLRQNMHLNEEALADFNEVLNLDPENVNAYVGLGYVYINMHERERASDSFLYAAKFEPDAENRERWLKIAEDVKELQWEVENTERDVTPEDEFQYPVFVGGRNALLTYVNNEAANRVQPPLGVKVVVDCLVDQKGYVAEAKIVEGHNEEIDAIAIEICKALPVFRPAMVENEPADCWYQIPIKF